MTRYGMVIDLKRCVACNACTVACKAENATRPGVFWSHVADIETGTYPTVRRLFVPLLCMHCANPPCVDVCPTGATFKRADGIVEVDYKKCMGCRYCEQACPYGARTFNNSARTYFPAEITPYEKVGYAKHQLGVVEKCTFCAHRLAQGLEPACVQTCITEARIFGDLDDPNSQVSKLIRERHGYQLKPEQDTDPSVYYLPA